MSEEQTALNMIDEILDWVVDNDDLNHISNFESKYNMKLDEALNLLNRYIKEGKRQYIIR